MSVLWLLLSLSVTLVVAGSPQCPCEDETQCQFQDGFAAGTQRQVFVFSDGATNVEEWHWDTFNTVVAPASFQLNKKEDKAAMCYTHKMKRQFSVTVNMELQGPLNNNSDAAKQWVQDAVTRRAHWFADMVTVNLMGYFSVDRNSTEADHVHLGLMVKDLKRNLNQDAKYNYRLMCVVPWRPPCPSEEKARCPFTQTALEACDFFLINPESFMDELHPAQCRAGPTIPYARLISGISDYIGQHVALPQLVIGIPWHGYDYTCFNKLNDVCNQFYESDQQTCHHKRERVSLASIYDRFRDKLDQPQTLPVYNSPHFNYKTSNEYHQVWYEEHLSLRSKYQLVIKLNLKGIAILYVDDLAGYTTRDLLKQEGLVWSWLSHQVLLHKTQTVEQGDHHVADTVAGVAVGCLLLGALLGVILTYLALRRRVRKPKARPFHSDGDMDEFTDDPDL